MSFKKIVLGCATLALLSGCMEGNKQGAGTGIGAVTGALLGSQFGGGSGKLVGVAVGALAGGFIGNSIGASMDKADQAAYERHAQRTFENAEIGQSQPWHSKRSSNSGNIIVNKTYQNSRGDYCREYTNHITVGGQTQKAYGTACRQPDGHWQIIQ